MAIIEGGIRFPFHPFFVQVLQELTLNSAHLSVNSYRVITSIVALSKAENLFRMGELSGAWKLGMSGIYPCYNLSSRPEFEMLLINRLPNSEEWANTYVAVSGNFPVGQGEPHDTPIQWEKGTPSSSFVFHPAFISSSS